MATPDAPPRNPDKAWLEARLGAGCLWQPKESDLPPGLTHTSTRDFLTTVGFPAIELDFAALDSTHLKRDTEDGRQLEAYDADELYGQRYPDDESPPTNFCFHFASHYEWMVMVGGEDGGVAHYDPAGWDHADGYQGPVANSLAAFAVLLSMLAEEREGLESSVDGLGEDEEERARKVVLDRVRERMIEYDDCVEAGSKFWDGVFESLE